MGPVIILEIIENYSGLKKIMVKKNNYNYTHTEHYTIKYNLKTVF